MEIASNKFIAELYNQSEFNAMLDISVRIDYLSQLFLDKPYIVNPQGEGIDGEF
ncbi:MAG: hypothetical protein ACD_29C00365G0001, partial [uncultured bacterium]